MTLAGTARGMRARWSGVSHESERSGRKRVGERGPWAGADYEIEMRAWGAGRYCRDEAALYCRDEDEACSLRVPNTEYSFFEQTILVGRVSRFPALSPNSGGPNTWRIPQPINDKAVV